MNRETQIVVMMMCYKVNLRGVFVLIRIILTGTQVIQVASGSGSTWIRNFCLDPDPELGKLKAECKSGINSFGSKTLIIRQVYSKILQNHHLNSMQTNSQYSTTVQKHKQTRMHSFIYMLFLFLLDPDPEL